MVKSLSRTQVKRRKAGVGGEVGSWQRSPISVGPTLVLATTGDEVLRSYPGRAFGLHAGGRGMVGIENERTR